MADLTFTKLADELPAGAITETVDDVTISVKSILGEASADLTVEKVAEFVAKLLLGANAAQVTHNALGGTTISSYPAPTFSTPTLAADGNYYSRRSFSFLAAYPLQVDEVSAA